MRLDTQIIEAEDGVKLFVRSYLPDSLADHVIPTGEFPTVFWVHGIGEHGGRHSHIAEVLTGRGWRMIVADLRGHGQSTGVQTHVRSFDDYVSDIESIWDQIGLTESRPVMLGHSAGGLIALRCVQSESVKPLALVLSSPLLGLRIKVNPLTVLLGRLLVGMIPTARFSNGIDPANMTRDSEFASKRRGDPLINKTVTAGWFFAMQSALKAAQNDVGKVTLPIMALQGALDRTTDPDAMSKWWGKIGSVQKRFMVMDDHVHELFFEPDWKETVVEMLDWLEQTIYQVKEQR